MSDSHGSRCRVVRSGDTYVGAQGLTYRAGITAASTGSRGICMTVAVIPRGARAKAHLHRDIETAVYVLEGAVDTHFGERLEERVTTGPGDYLYIAPDTPHVVVNRSDRECRAVVAHSGPDDQAGIELMPELDGKV
jgi:uncharacterized RmlC-like cupin family protein